MKSRMAGVGMIEVLVALLVLAIGILGVVGLQVVARQNTYESVQRTTAAWLAQSIVSRMRANRDDSALLVYAGWRSRTGEYKYTQQGNSGNNGNTSNTSNNGNNGNKASDNGPKNCFVKTCTPAEMASFDLRQIKKVLNGLAVKSTNESAVGGLVNPSVCITKSSNATHGSGTYTIVIAWRSMRAHTLQDSDNIADATTKKYRRAIHLCTNGLEYLYDAPQKNKNGGSKNKAARTFRRTLVLRTYIASEG